VRRKAWLDAAQLLGLTPFFGPRYLEVFDFHSIKHALWPPDDSSGEPRAPHGAAAQFVWWAHGERLGTEVLAGIPFEKVIDHGDPVEEQRTVAVARIHPSLLLGLNLSRTTRDSVERFKAIDLPRARAVFTRFVSDGLDANDPIAQALSYGMRVRVTDTAVAVIAPRVVPEELRTMLESAAVVARRLGEARRTLPPSDFETRVSREWRAFAAASDLRFDPESILIHGRASGFDVAVALFARGPRYAVDLRARLLRPIDEIRFMSVRRGSTVDRLTRWLGERVETGDARFDRSCYVTGGPHPAVKALLDAPARGAVQAALEIGEGVTVHRDSLWVHLATVPDRQELERAVAGLLGVARALTPPPAASAYR
jgi:hypothetical protein